MSCSDDAAVGGPIVEVKPKRSFDEVPIDFDWHDYLIRQPDRGRAYATNDRVRLSRARSTGLQYKCTTAGVTGNTEPRWPKVAAGTVLDGTVVWTAEAIDVNSQRTTISTSNFPAVTGLVISSPTIADLKYTVTVAGGVSGQEYQVKHQVGLANGEDKEAVAVLPVID